jgi:hypothetical protein
MILVGFEGVLRLWLVIRVNNLANRVCHFILTAQARLTKFKCESIIMLIIKMAYLKLWAKRQGCSTCSTHGKDEKCIQNVSWKA